MHYHIHKELQDVAIWTWPSSKGQTKVNIKLVRDFDVENISVKLRNDTGNSCRIIVFTRHLDLERVLKFKKSHKGQCRTRPRLLCREHLYKVSTWYRQSAKSYRIHKLPDVAHHLPVCPPAQATTIHSSLSNGLRGKKWYCVSCIFSYCFKYPKYIFLVITQDYAEA